jgi:hypothetical protein
LKRTETKIYDDIQDTRDAFDIAVLDEDQIEPDGVNPENVTLVGSLASLVSKSDIVDPK